MNPIKPYPPVPNPLANQAEDGVTVNTEKKHARDQDGRDLTQPPSQRVRFTEVLKEHAPQRLPSQNVESLNSPKQSQSTSMAKANVHNTNANPLGPAQQTFESVRAVFKATQKELDVSLGMMQLVQKDLSAQTDMYANITPADVQRFTACQRGRQVPIPYLHQEARPVHHIDDFTGPSGPLSLFQMQLPVQTGGVISYVLMHAQAQGSRAVSQVAIPMNAIGDLVSRMEGVLAIGDSDGGEAIETYLQSGEDIFRIAYNDSKKCVEVSSNLSAIGSNSLSSFDVDALACRALGDVLKRVILTNAEAASYQPVVAAEQSQQQMEDLFEVHEVLHGSSASETTVGTITKDVALESNT